MARKGYTGCVILVLSSGSDDAITLSRESEGVGGT
jgi:hypothetical protein